MSSFRDDAGFGLIEVVVSAFLTVVIASAILTGFEVASRTSGNSKAQAIASNLAQQDQERMRSLPVEDLLAAQAPRTPQVDGVTYTVRSEGVALKNADGEAGCTAGGSGLVKASSTVSWPSLAPDRRPVKVVSLIARPFVSDSLTTGSALLVLRDADDNPVPSQSVRLSGVTSELDTTDAEGCAYFPDIPSGDYTFHYATPGWIDPDGVNDVAVNFSVGAQQLTTEEKSYDRGGSVPVSDVQSRIPTRSNPAGVPAGTPPAVAPGTPPGAFFSSTTAKIRFASGSISRIFAPVAGPLGLLYPFRTDYAVHTGLCAANAGLTPADAASLGPTFSQTVRVIRGATSPAIKLFQPSIDVRITFAAAPVPGARVVFTPSDPACGPPIVRSYSRADGRLDDADLGLPYGPYTVCATYRGTPGTAGPILRYRNVPGVANTLLAGRKLELSLANVTSAPVPSTCVG